MVFKTVFLRNGRSAAKRIRHYLRLPLLALVLGGGALVILTMERGLDWTISQMLVWTAAILLVVPVLLYIVKRRK